MQSYQGYNCTGDGQSVAFVPDGALTQNTERRRTQNTLRRYSRRLRLSTSSQNFLSNNDIALTETKRCRRPAVSNSTHAIHLDLSMQFSASSLSLDLDRA